MIAAPPGLRTRHISRTASRSTVVGQAVEHVERRDDVEGRRGKRDRRGAGLRHAGEAGTPGELQACPRQIESARLAVRLEQQAQVGAGAASAVEQAQIASGPRPPGPASAPRSGGSLGTRSDRARRARWLRAVDPRPYSIPLASTRAACHNDSGHVLSCGCFHLQRPAKPHPKRRYADDAIVESPCPRARPGRRDDVGVVQQEAARGRAAAAPGGRANDPASASRRRLRRRRPLRPRGR